MNRCTVEAMIDDDDDVEGILAWAVNLMLFVGSFWTKKRFPILMIEVLG